MEKQMFSFLYCLLILLPSNYCDICDLCECKQIESKSNDAYLFDGGGGDGGDNNGSVYNKNETIPNNSEQKHRKTIKIINIKCVNEIKNNLILELDNIQWPSSPIDTSKNIEVYFNNLKLNYMPKILGIPAVKRLNFDNNQIDSITFDPFKYTKNIEYLSIANNSIKNLAPDFLKSTKYIKELNFSHNLLTHINNEILEHLDQLTILDISHNRLKMLTAEMLTLIPSVITLNLQGNQIFKINANSANDDDDDDDEDEDVKDDEDDNVKDSIHTSLITLNLANNNLSYIWSSTLEYFQKLEHLNLSSNALRNIEENAFLKLTNLKVLDLSSNHLNDLLIELPNSLEHLILKSNAIQLWPTISLPINLKYLEIQNNQLSTIFWSPEIIAHNLRLLNVSNNKIKRISTKLFLPNLKQLDLSKNEFEQIPIDMVDNFPTLHTLILNENPITVIHFGRINVLNLQINDMAELQFIDEDSFIDIDNEEDICMQLSISNCPKLNEIHPNALNNLNLCYLDLSYNNFTTLSENLTNWMNIYDGVNLQGNPFYCNCSMQWMLDIILQQLYGHEEHQRYLNDFKCFEPEPFAGHRFVKYYNQPGAFCDPFNRMMMKMMAEPQDAPNIEMAAFGHQIKIGEEGDYNLFLTEGIGFIIAVTVCSITICVMIMFTIYCAFEQRRQRVMKNRRYEYY